jgi:ethanolaminephosphotransferase
MGCYALISILDPDLTANSFNSPPEQNIPKWVWLVCAIGTFLAHLLDGTDGKQARRTGASGPTGELCKYYVNISHICIYKIFS